MKLMDEALQSHSCVISVMGAHANEGSETIFGRKMQDIDKTGMTYWLMRSPKARPPEVQDICKTTTSYVIFIEPASKGGARPTTTVDAASQFSPDRRSWKALPPGIGPVTGKLDTGATALVFDRLETVPSGTIDLWAYAEAVDSRTPLKFILGCSTVCAVKNDMSPHPGRMKYRYRSVVAVARLVSPFCVWLK
jgi:hypothetical protein